MFDWLFGRSLPVYRPSTGWQIKPADYKGPHQVTAFWEDMPDNCFDCGAEVEENLSEPLMIEGEIQYMKITRLCPKGCGRTEWIA